MNAAVGATSRIAESLPEVLPSQLKRIESQVRRSHNLVGSRTILGHSKPVVPIHHDNFSAREHPAIEQQVGRFLYLPVKADDRPGIEIEHFAQRVAGCKRTTTPVPHPSAS